MTKVHLATDKIGAPGVIEQQIAALCDTGDFFYRRGWALGTSGNYSVVVRREPLELLITASGRHAGRLQPEDFVRIAADGQPVAEESLRASAEALLHVTAAQLPGVGAVLHTHSIWATLLSDVFFANGGIEISGYEMLKGLAGVTTHEHAAWIEIFDNTQNIPELAERVAARFADRERPLRFGYLIRRHGLYTWGRDVDEARRHVEVLEFLLECEARRLALRHATDGTALVN